MPVGLLLFGAYLALGFEPGAFGIHIAVISMLVRYAVLRENAQSQAVERNVRIAKEGIHVDGNLIPREAFSEGWFQPRAEGSSIRLLDRSRRVVFEALVSDEAQGQRLLRAMGLDASQRRAEFRTVSPVAENQGYALAFAVAFMLLIIGANTFAGPLPLLSGFALFFGLSYWPAKVVVGVDGILLTWLWRRRFIPMSDVVSISEDGTTKIHLELTGDRTETIGTASHKARHGAGVHLEKRDLLLARMRAAWQAHRSLGQGADLSPLVARGGRSLDAWKTALASLETTDAGYRQASLREEDLWRLVEDPRASEDARAGAALVLRRGLDDAGRARVRVAAEATASPLLRVALESVSAATDDDDALAALDAIEPRPAREAGR